MATEEIDKSASPDNSDSTQEGSERTEKSGSAPSSPSSPPPGPNRTNSGAAPARRPQSITIPPPGIDELEETYSQRTEISVAPDKTIDDQIAELETWAQLTLKVGRAEAFRLWALRLISFFAAIGAVGALLGCVMAFSNLYIGLKAGWSLSVAITACIISYTIFRVFHAAFPVRRAARSGRLLGIFDRPEPGEVSILENNCMQSTASAAGYSTGATLVSAFPAYLMITGHNPPFWTVAGLVCATGLLGVFLAVP